MMNRTELNFWLNRINRLLFRPSLEWGKIREKPTEKNTLFRRFFIPFCIAVAFAVLFISLLRLKFFYALGYALINLTSNLLGTYAVSLFIGEYLSGKIPHAGNTALNLTVFSATVFLFFHSLSAAFGSNFLGQLTGLCSLIFLRTLYSGVYITTDLPTNQKNNLFIITGLAIIFIPVIIHKLLMILFHIPVFNV